MREILFRGKRKNTGEWIEGNYVYAPEGEGTYEDEQHFILMIPKHGGVGMDHEVIPETVGQWTGLTDRHGTKIFDGDVVHNGFANAIVKLGRHSIPCCGCCYTWHDSVGFYLDFGEYIGSDEHTFDDLEVMGNIHDNPELLEVK